MKPVLYGIGVSLYVRKVRFLLEHKGVEYDFDPVLPSKSADYLEISPLGKVPALRCGDFGISDSSVMALYLEKKYPQNPTLPKNPEEYARALWFDEYSDTKMTEIISTVFFEKFGKPMLFDQQPDQERIAELETHFPEIFDYLEKQLIGKNYLAGEALSIGDFAVISNLYNHLACGYTIDENSWPNLSSYQARLLAEPAIASVIAQEREEMPLA